MYFHPSERILVLIDGVNLNSTHKSLDFDIDYKKLLALFRSQGVLQKALFYTTVFEQQEYSSVRPLVDWLEYNGFTLVTKPAKEVVDPKDRRRFRGNMHVEMAVDAMRLASTVDHIVLFSGEGGFKSLVAALQQMGKRVSVVSTLQTRPPMVEDELRRQADQFVDLADLEPRIGRVRQGPRDRDVIEPVDDQVDDGESGGQADNEPRISVPVDAGTGTVDVAAKPAVVVERRTRTPVKPG